MLGEVGERMDQGLPVAGDQGIRARHDAAPAVCSASVAIDRARIEAPAIIATRNSGQGLMCG
jgi:hypothetical protein